MNDDAKGGADEADSSPGEGSFARGLLFTLVLAIPLWGLIGAACYWATR